MTMYARIAPTDGPWITDDTTCTIGEVTMPVPPSSPRGGRIATFRLIDALESLGYQSANGLGDRIEGDGWFDVAVVPLDGA